MKLTMSEQVNEIFSALSKAQGKIQPAYKDKSNPYFKSKYADLASTWDACRQPLCEQGLCVIQTPQETEKGTSLVTILGHSSGQWIKGEIDLPLLKKDPQSIGSILTYFRRYCLQAMAGVAPEDDDGERAQAPYRSQKQEEVKVSLKKISEKDVEELTCILNECDVNYSKWVYEHMRKIYKVESIADLPQDVFDRMRAAAVKRIQEAALQAVS